MAKVLLYVYDLSNGMARSMSLPLTGKQIDGIWHTSVVVFNREVFYGQGISECGPGKSHHGQPVQVIDCGETEIDQVTFNEYIDSMRDLYTADAYHLLTFNCNSFTQDVIGFLTGGSIPEWISNLPADFLSTPFGAALAPRIDAMFRRGPVGAVGSGGSGSDMNGGFGAGAGNNAIANGMLRDVVGQATSNGGGGGGSTSGNLTAATTPRQSISATSSTASPLLMCTNLPSFHSHLSTHPCLIALFTNPATCPPCRVIDPIFDSLSKTHSKAGKIGFVKIDMGIGEGSSIAGNFGVRVTPTFLFFEKGKKVDEMKGASARELEFKVEGFVERCFPPHPHEKIYLGAVKGITLEPILPGNKANYPALMNKLKGYLEEPRKEEVRVALGVLEETVIPRLLGSSGQSLKDEQLGKIMEEWRSANKVLFDALKPEEAFPVIDLVVFGLSDTRISSWTTLSTQDTTGNNMIDQALVPASVLCSSISSDSKTPTTATKPTLLTTLRLLQMSTKSLSLSRGIFLPHSPISPTARKIFLHCQLHEDVAVRNAAAGLAMNLAGMRHRDRKEHERRGVEMNVMSAEEGEVDEDWELEFLSAVVESIERTEDEDILYRLVAALALQLYLSPIYNDLRSFLEVMEVKQKLDIKRIAKAAGKPIVTRLEVKKLMIEVGEKLC